MSGSESTGSSQSVSKPLTAAERQDLYNSSIGSIKNTLGQSGSGYTNSTPATFGTQSGGNGIFAASGNSSTSNKNSIRSHLGLLGLGLSPDSTVKMPTGTPDQGGLNMPTYRAPNYQSSGPGQVAAYQGPGEVQQLTNGDYQVLQDKMTAGYTAPLDYAKARDLADANNSAGAKGLWSSGLAMKAEGDIKTGYAPQYAKAGADATNAATGYQAAQNANVNAYQLAEALGANNFNTENAANQNAYNLTAADKANTFNMDNAAKQNTADWAPLQYLKSLWDATSGQTSGSTGVNQSFSMGIGGSGGSV